jgi:integrase
MEAIPLKSGKTTYRYHPVGGTPIHLGHDRTEAIRAVLDLLGSDQHTGTLNWLWDQFTTHSTRWQKYATHTRTDYTDAWKQISQRLGHMRLTDLDTRTIAHYIHKERAPSPKRANTEKALLTVLLDYAITTGDATTNPARHIPPHQISSQARLPDPQAVHTLIQWLSTGGAQRQVIACMAEFAALAGNRRIELRHLQWTHIDLAAGTISTTRAKQRSNKRGTVIERISISPRMAALIQQLQHIHATRGTGCIYVFPDRDNNPYSDKAFKSIWQRCMQDAITTGIITPAQRFTFHSLRSLYTTTYKARTGKLPDLHANPATTASIYDRSTEVPRQSL